MNDKVLMIAVTASIGMTFASHGMSAIEELELWHYSPVMLGEMFVEADRTGVIPYPEEA